MCGCGWLSFFYLCTSSSPSFPPSFFTSLSPSFFLSLPLSLPPSFLPSSSPLQRPLRQELHTVRQGHGTTRGPLSPCEDDRFDGTVDLREGDLQGYLDGVQAQFRGLEEGREGETEGEREGRREGGREGFSLEERLGKKEGGGREGGEGRGGRYLPLFEGLEDEGDGAEVRLIQLLEHLHRLVVVLCRGPAHEGEARQIHDRVYDDHTW